MRAPTQASPQGVMRSKALQIIMAIAFIYAIMHCSSQFEEAVPKEALEAYQAAEGLQQESEAEKPTDGMEKLKASIMQSAPVLGTLPELTLGKCPCLDDIKNALTIAGAGLLATCNAWVGDDVKGAVWMVVLITMATVVDAEAIPHYSCVALVGGLPNPDCLLAFEKAGHLQLCDELAAERDSICSKRSALCKARTREHVETCQHSRASFQWLQGSPLLLQTGERDVTMPQAGEWLDHASKEARGIIQYTGTEHGCSTAHGQCFWRSVSTAKKECAAWKECAALYCTSKYNGGLVKATHGICLDASQRSSNGGTVHMWACNPNNQNQQWTYSTSTKQLKATHGICLDASQRSSNGGKVHMWACNPNNQNQQWDINADTSDGGDQVCYARRGGSSLIANKAGDTSHELKRFYGGFDDVDCQYVLGHSSLTTIGVHPGTRGGWGSKMRFTPKDAAHAKFVQWHMAPLPDWMSHHMPPSVEQCCSLMLDWSIKVCRSAAFTAGDRRRRNTECDINGRVQIVTTTTHSSPFQGDPKANYALVENNRCPGNDAAWERVVCRGWLNIFKCFLNDQVSRASSAAQYAFSEAVGTPPRMHHPRSQCEMQHKFVRV